MSKTQETFAENLEEGLIRLSHAMAIASIPFERQADKVMIVVQDRALFYSLQNYILTNKAFYERSMIDSDHWVHNDQFEFMGWRFVCPPRPR